MTSDPSAVRTSTVAAIVYGEEIAAELASMKIFVVGSGAIGCELLKTFALLGVGVGSGGGSDVGVESYKGRESNKKNDLEVVSGSGLWDCLSEGGIVLTDIFYLFAFNILIEFVLEKFLHLYLSLLQFFSSRPSSFFFFCYSLLFHFFTPSFFENLG